MLRFLIHRFRKFKKILVRITLKLFYTDKQFKIGSKLEATNLPTITITDNATVKIGDNVILREDVEIRAHKNSTLEIGNNCRIDRGVRILATNNSRIKISDGVRIGLYSVLNGGDSITIGNKSLVSGFVYLQTSMHNYQKEGDIQNQGFSHNEILLGSDVWVGAHATIMPGVNLGNGSIVGSNAVVTKSFEGGSIIAGVPAKILSNRNLA